MGARRKWAARVKTGCVTCRVRHLKCDEARPNCNRCISGRRECRYSLAFSHHPDTLSLFRPAVAPNPAHVKVSSRDIQTFYMFRKYTVTRVSGLFEQNFWTEQIVRAAGIYPAIWHATLASSAMQQWKYLNSVSGIDDYSTSTPAGMDYFIFAFRHYTQAVTELVAIAQKPIHTYQDQETILSAEILFVGINSMAGYLKEARQHAKNIIKLYDAWDFARQDVNLGVEKPGSLCSPTQNAVLKQQSIVTFVSNIKVQFVNRLGYAFLVKENNQAALHQQFLRPATPHWTVDDAYHEMIQFLFEYLLSAKRDESLQAGILPSQPGNILACKNLHTWTCKFRTFSQLYLNLSQIDAQERFGWRMLDLYQRIMRVSLAHDKTGSNTWSWYRWDQHTTKFFKILEDLEQLAEEWLTQCRTTAEQKSKAEFSFSMSMAESCYFLSIACRDHDLRCRASALLRRWGVCDGMWDSNLMAAVIEASMNVEEEAGLANRLRYAENEQSCPCIYRKYICDEHRIWTRRIQFIGVGQAAFYYSTVASSKNTEEMQMRLLRY